LISKPDLDEPISDFLRYRSILATLLSLEITLSECSPGIIFLSLSKVGKLSTSHTI